MRNVKIKWIPKGYISVCVKNSRQMETSVKTSVILDLTSSVCFLLAGHLIFWKNYITQIPQGRGLKLVSAAFFHFISTVKNTKLNILVG